MMVDGVTDIFRRVLETDEVDAESDFFALGGDSLLATRVLSAVARRLRRGAVLRRLRARARPRARRDRERHTDRTSAAHDRGPHEGRRGGGRPGRPDRRRRPRRGGAAR